MWELLFSDIINKRKILFLHSNLEIIKDYYFRVDKSSHWRKQSYMKGKIWVITFFK